MRFEYWEGIRGPMTAKVSHLEGLDVDLTMGEITEVTEVGDEAELTLVSSITWASNLG